ncbi:hypothetical protein PsorP6_007901 [Peronosclerospora sorghi]|uniref:Uncharacterized protein n=1 Tax=Peronosclerospora sorghi TaxID=230839 RepID=A0ACC0WB10_9STRA|nr:hypothetical protein PsorP6_007901 [Peronosclerospora sorghi]
MSSLRWEASQSSIIKSAVPYLRSAMYINTFSGIESAGLFNPKFDIGQLVSTYRGDSTIYRNYTCS